MQKELGPLDLPKADEHDDADVAVHADMERPRRMVPAYKKAIEYKRDRRFVSEYPHTERKSWPRKKALRNQTHRRQVDRALQPALGEVTPEIDDFAPALPRRPRSASRNRHGNIPLGEWVHNKLEKRVSFAGRNIGVKVARDRYRRRLIPFFESLTEGRQGYSVELARRFARALDSIFQDDDRINTYDERYERYWERYIWGQAMTTLFAEQPEWETKLRAWIAEVAPGELPSDEPSWRRIRRLRGRPAR